MKTLRKYRELLVAGLILVLLPIFAAKSFHTHSEISCTHTSTDENSHSLGQICKICDFVLSPFEENPQTEFKIVVTKNKIENLPLIEQVVCGNKISFSLRGPPNCI